MIDDSSLHIYGLILRKLIHGIFASCDGHSSGYSLPLSEDDRDRAAEFRDALENFVAEFDEEVRRDEDKMPEESEDEDTSESEDEDLDNDGATSKKRAGNSLRLGVIVPDDLVDSFHCLIKSFLYPRLMLPGSHSRWDDPLECFIALFSLSQTGNFKAAGDMTQAFAQLHYLMRSVIFYEAHHQWKDSTRDFALEQ
jgi:hypothetical protein